jgi:hypothetical protein
LQKILAIRDLITPPQWKVLLKQLLIDEILRYQPPPKDDHLPGFPDAKRTKPIEGRATWDTGKKGEQTLQWDSQHGRVELYDKQGNHKGEYDYKTGEQTKPAKPGRKIKK